MKFWKLSIIVLLAALPLVQGCKDDDDDDDSEYLDGSLSLKLPNYVQPGFSKTYKIDSLMTLSRDDDGLIGYYMKDPFTGVSDTLVSAKTGEILNHYFTVEVPDTLGSFTFTLGGFVADGYYYSSSTSKSFVVVKPGFNGEASITNFNLSEDEAKLQFKDARDGKKYYYTDIDGTKWMRQNLGWNGAGISFQAADAMDEIFGRFYTWKEAQTACPEGWTLPSDEDWAALGKKYGTTSKAGKSLEGLAGDLMGDIYFNGSKMWEFWRTVKITDDSRLSVYPVGYVTISGTDYTFSGIYSYALFWTSDSTDSKGAGRYIYEDKDNVYYGTFSKTDVAASVRCIKK